MGAHAFPQRGDRGSVTSLHLPELARGAPQLPVGPSDEDLRPAQAAGGLEVFEVGHDTYVAVCWRRGHRWASPADGLDAAVRAECEVCTALARAFHTEIKTRLRHRELAARLGW